MFDKGDGGVRKDSAEALTWYRKSAEQGNASAQFNLGQMYANGDGVLKDSAEAAKWYRKSADQGNSKAQYNLGVIYANGNGVLKDSAEAAKWYRKSAEQGTADAQVRLGVMYAKGDGVLKDSAEAAKWYRKSAEQGNAYAQFCLGWSYLEGDGVLQDSAEAVRWYRKSAEQGADGKVADDRDSAVFVARAVLEFDKYFEIAERLAGVGEFQKAIRKFNNAIAVKPSYRINSERVRELNAVLLGQNTPIEVPFKSDGKTWVSIRAFRAPQKLSGVSAIKMLPGNYLITGRREGFETVNIDLKLRFGTKPSVIEVACSKKADARDSANTNGGGNPEELQFTRLYQMDLAGDRVAEARLETDFAMELKAIRDMQPTKLLHSAAEKGDAVAQFNLGLMYRNGDGVPKDSREAAKWFRKSAEQGNAVAQCNLGLMYAEGDGVLKDSVQAHAWYNNASANGNESAKKNLGLIEKEMTPEQKAEATKFAREIIEQIQATKK